MVAGGYFGGLQIVTDANGNKFGKLFNSISMVCPLAVMH